MTQSKGQRDPIIVGSNVQKRLRQGRLAKCFASKDQVMEV